MAFAAGCPPVIAVINKGESNFLPKTDNYQMMKAMIEDGLGSEKGAVPTGKRIL